MNKSLPIVISCCLSSVILFSCKNESTLPPQATGKGGDSSNIEILNDVEKQVISSYEDWDFGSKAYTHTKNILKIGPRPIESEGHKKVQAYITEHLEKFGWVVSRQSIHSKTPYGMRNFVNLIARRKGTTKSPDIVLAAHYDSKILDDFIGADDAASCVGALLEIAEQLPSHENAITQKMELVFFDGEEAITDTIEFKKDGLYGSIYYSTYMRNDVAGDKKTYQHIPDFGILLDMIGHRNLSIKVPSDTPKKLLNSYKAVVKKHQLGDRFGIANGPILDDHYPMNVIADLPTMDIIGDFSNKTWWHTNRDNLHNISENSLNVSIQVALEIIKHQLAVAGE